MAGKSLTLTYILWLTCGLLGVHHFYLGRDRHAFVWFWTLGGFWFGWLAEVCRLSSYVDLANNRGRAFDKEARRIAQGFQPPFSWKRAVGELTFGIFLGCLSVSAIPEELLAAFPYLSLIGSVFVAVGVHTVANIGSERVPFSKCLLASAGLFPLYVFSQLDSIYVPISYSAITSCIVANWKWKTYRDRNAVVRRRCHLCTRILILLTVSGILSGMMVSTIYHNTYITTRDGQRVRFRDAVHNVLSSPAWAEFRTTVGHLFHMLWSGNYDNFRRDLNIALDPEGEERAYVVLGLYSSATQKEITEQYRRLVKQYHPDRVQATSDDERREAESHFREIQESYEKLSTIKQRRRASMHTEL